jgi:nucleoside-diphosphate-sugar epimerase
LSYTNNVAVTAGLLEKCRLHGVRHFIFASTSAVYENSKEYPTPEHTGINPDLLYSMGKKHAEDVITSFGTLYGLPFTLLRFFNVYGSHQDSIRANPPLLPYLVSCFKNNVQPVLHSDGLQRRDYIHVSDVISLIHKIMTLPATNDVYNVCTGETVSVRELVELLQSKMEVSIQPIYRDPVLLWDKTPILWKGEHTFPKTRMMEEVNKYSCGDPSKTYLRFEWKAVCSIQDGIRKLLE